MSTAADSAKQHWLKRLRYSLSARLLLLFIIAAIAVVFILSAAFGIAFQRQFRDVLRPHVVQYLDYILLDIGNPPSVERAKDLARRLPIEIYIRSATGAWSSNPLPLDLSRFRDWHSHKERGGKLTISDDDHGRFLIRASAGDATVFLVLQPRLDRRHGGFWVGLLSIGAMLLVLLTSYWLIRRLFKPIDQIQHGVRRFAAGDLAHRVEVKRRDELGDLARSINAMAGEISKMLEAKRQLLLAISHELRSPLTRAKVNAALLDSSRSKAALEIDLQEMEALLGDLLESERLSGRHSVLNRQAVALHGLLHELITEQFEDAKLNIEDCERELYVYLDPMRIKLMLKNLIENALRYSPAEHPPEIHCAFDGKELILEVRDYGPGIAAEHLPHLTEPFYRADPARHRKTGGYGLGLYLCRVIAEAHGGQLLIKSHIGSGTKVRVILPIQQNDA